MAAAPVPFASPARDPTGGVCFDVPLNRSPRSIKSPTQARLEARQQKDITVKAREVVSKLENADANRANIIAARKTAASTTFSKAIGVASSSKKASEEHIAELAQKVDTKQTTALTKRQQRNLRMKERAAAQAAKAKAAAEKAAQIKMEHATAVAQHVKTSLTAAQTRREAMTAAVVEKCGAQVAAAKNTAAAMKSAHEDTGCILRESMEQRLEQASQRRRAAVEDVQLAAGTEVQRAKDAAARAAEMKAAKGAELKAKHQADMQEHAERREQFLENRRRSTSPNVSPAK